MVQIVFPLWGVVVCDGGFRTEQGLNLKEYKLIVQISFICLSKEHL